VPWCYRSLAITGDIQLLADLCQLDSKLTNMIKLKTEPANNSLAALPTSTPCESVR
jgi:hypothetical protein